MRFRIGLGQSLDRITASANNQFGGAVGIEPGLGTQSDGGMLVADGVTGIA